MHMSSDRASLCCDYCKSIQVPEADDLGVRYFDELPELQCPVCTVPLWNSTLTGISIGACKQCRGLLIKMPTFEDLIEQVRTEHPGTVMTVGGDAADVSRKLECPSCHHTMDTHFYYGGGHVVMEDCERCNVNWLDGGALLRIVHAPHRQEGESYSF
jgi:Zn-finger nucleic acid-binding protein